MTPRTVNGRPPIRIRSPTLMPELRQQLRSDQRAAVLDERVRIRLAVLQREGAVERISRLHTPQLHHPRDRVALSRRAPSSRSRSIRCEPPPARPAVCCSRSVADFRRPRTAALNEHVGGDGRAGFAHQAGSQALNDRAQRHDRRDANRHADEEEQQPPPGRAQLARDHLQDEAHDTNRGIRDPADSASSGRSELAEGVRIRRHGATVSEPARP